jgi:hypothetical protein
MKWGHTCQLDQLLQRLSAIAHGQVLIAEYLASLAFANGGVGSEHEQPFLQ